MVEANTMVSNFIKNLENHPNGRELIEIVTDVINSDLVGMDSYLISSIQMLTGNNPAILVDLCFLRSSILREQGLLKESFHALFEAVTWSQDNIDVYSRVIEEFLSHNDLFYASYFIGISRNLFRDDALFSSEKSEIIQAINRNLEVLPGILVEHTSQKSARMNFKDSTKSKGSFGSEKVLNPSKEIPKKAMILWGKAIRYFSAAHDADESDNLRSFIHYAHLTIREILSLDGNFKEGLDPKLSEYRLLEFKKSLSHLNHIRNLVIHEDREISLEQAKQVKDLVVYFIQKFSENK
ncbi:MAG: hypothetical protein ACTSR2_07475 [Candidatus Hodarchaeales archaeon]